MRPEHQEIENGTKRKNDKQVNAYLLPRASLFWHLHLSPVNRWFIRRTDANDYPAKATHGDLLFDREITRVMQFMA
jgi:hypothetical protein